MCLRQGMNEWQKAKEPLDRSHKENTPTHKHETFQPGHLHLHHPKSHYPNTATKSSDMSLGTTDILGLRAQILANFAFLRPESRPDTLKIVMAADDVPGQAARYTAILVWTHVDGTSVWDESTNDVPTRGKESDSVDGALRNLLDVVARGVGRKVMD